MTDPRSTHNLAAADAALGALREARPSAIASLSLERAPDEDKLMLYYGIDPATLATRPEEFASVLEFLARASREIEGAMGASPTCVPVASGLTS